MAGLNLSQITDKLNGEFTSNSRKIVFWYDENAEFEKDIEFIVLENAKVHRLKQNDLFATKLLLENKDVESNYLIYAPFKRPLNRDNHLADTMLYSTVFSADRATLIMVELGINNSLKPVLTEHINFFNAKSRTENFLEYLVDNYTKDSIEITMMSVLTKAKNANFEEIVRIMITDEGLEESKYLKEFDKYNLLVSFWSLCAKEFGYNDENPSLLKFIISLFITYTSKIILKDIPSELEGFLLEKPGTVITFVDQVMNNLIYKEHFDILSEQVFRSIHGTDIFESFEAEDLIDLDVFSFADKVIIEWIINRLSDENLNATIDGKKIQDICQYRIKKHYGYRYSSDYMMLQHGYNILKAINITFEKSPVNVVKKYDEEYYKFDMSYRKFYYYFDQIKENSRYEKLASLIENVYINKYLDPLDIGFNNEFNYEAFSGYYKLQKDFYRNYLGNSKEREVIIISDAFRYEVAKELVERLLTNEKMKASIEPNIGILPSITKVGMAALLPHDEIGIDEEYNVQVDGDPCNSLVQRQAILKKKDKKAVCIQFDEIKKYKRDKLREFVQDTSKIYIYHNQIDTRGDDLKTEDEVFVACEEAINEIIQLINRLTIDVSAHKYIITSDHGFIYKREPISEAEKINKFYETGDYANRRFVISNKVYEEQGTYNIKLNREMGISCNKCMTFPNTSNVLKLPGGGQNFFHGGLSPQEIIIPVVRIKTVRGAVVTNPAKITLISIIPKITNLNVSLEFVQSEPVSELIKPATYKIYFADKNGNTISNIEELIANKRDKETAKRISKLSFRFKDMKYDRSDEYYLIAMNVNSGANLIKQKVVMDIVFSSGFGFDI